MVKMPGQVGRAGPYEDRGRDWSSATGQRTAGTSRSRKEQGRILSLNLWKEHGPAGALIWDCSFQNYERISFCCFKPLSLWKIVTGN